jgi:N-acyl-D-amino-acid deacylase
MAWFSGRIGCLAFVWLAIASNASGADHPSYDLVIRNGRIVDGTGNPWYYGDVAIRGERIVTIGKVPAGRAKREIDARGLVVSPGFIDIHSHSDYLLLEDGNAPSKVRQGVTTEVLGEGGSPGPVVGAAPPRPIYDGARLPAFKTLGAYFDAIEKGGVAVNIVSYVGLDNIWQCVMGTSFDRPTPDQIGKMKILLDEAMRDGAFGLASMLALPPGSLATTGEIIELCKVVAPYGGIYSTHNRHEGTGVFDAVKEAIAIGEGAEIPVDVIHLKIADQILWGKMDQLVTLIETARKRGVDVHANVYPYVRGVDNLWSIIPPWAHEGGREKMLERLKDPALRPRLKQEIREGLPGWYNHYTAVGSDWSRVLVSGKGTYAGLTMDRVIAARMKDRTLAIDPLDAFFEIVIEHGGSLPTIYEHHTEADMNLAMIQPWCSIGSDGLAYATEGTLRRGNPHPRSFGTFPRILGVYVRERGLLRLEEAIRKMTSLNASKIGLADRGLLRPGTFADVTLFDPERVIDKSTYEDPFHYSEGIEYVIVNGTLVLDKGNPTGARPGRAIRRGRGP